VVSGAGKVGEVADADGQVELCLCDGDHGAGGRGVGRAGCKGMLNSRSDGAAGWAAEGCELVQGGLVIIRTGMDRVKYLTNHL